MDRADIEAFLVRHQESFARRDAKALAADHAIDGTFESPAHGVVKGREAIEGVYRFWFAAFPDLQLTWTDPLVGTDRTTFFWDLAGTATGPFFGMVGTGARVTMAGAAEYRFVDGLIQSARHIFDFSGMLLKTGALKVKPK